MLSTVQRRVPKPACRKGVTQGDSGAVRGQVSSMHVQKLRGKEPEEQEKWESVL